MPQLGFALSSEEHLPNDLVRQARMAEDAGFTFALISDHYHPWVDSQGHSPFVWAVIGGISQATKTLRLGTGVTCPTTRIHPAIIAQAAATANTMLEGRFFLGVGSGENLNEHILGDVWPGPHTRLEMLEEAIAVIRQLWEGGYQSFDGVYYEVDNARIYTLPPRSTQIMVAAAGPSAARLAGECGDGLIGTSPDRELIQSFDAAGGSGKPRYGQLTVCYDTDEQRAIQTAKRIWPNAGLPGELSQELPLPRHFEQACQLVTDEMVAQSVVCGPDPRKHLEKIQKYAEAGFDHIYMHQVGPDQESFFRFYEREIIPQLKTA